MKTSGLKTSHWHTSAKLGWSEISPVWLPPSRKIQMLPLLWPHRPLDLSFPDASACCHNCFIFQNRLLMHSEKIKTHHLQGRHDTGSLAPQSASLIVTGQRDTAFPSTWKGLYPVLDILLISASRVTLSEKIFFHGLERELWKIALFPPEFQWLSTPTTHLCPLWHLYAF